MPDDLIDLYGIARLLNVDIGTVRQWSKRDQLPEPDQTIGKVRGWKPETIGHWAGESGFPHWRRAKHG